MYAFNKLIRHLVILVLKYSTRSFLVVLFVVFQKLRKICIKDILKFIDREVVRNQGKTSMKISTAVLVFHHINGR